jgi:hypothetical protein
MLPCDPPQTYIRIHRYIIIVEDWHTSEWEQNCKDDPCSYVYSLHREKAKRRWMEVDLEVDLEVEHTAEVIQEIVLEELAMWGIVPEEVVWNERQSSGGAETDATREPNQL